jgi:branched-chain amino acid transport system ATP-binding protein
MLALNKINTFYDKSHILHDVSFEIGDGEIVGLLGRNGVGKSTTLKSIMGLVSPRSGSIQLDGKEVAGLEGYQMARLGVGYVPEDRRIFPTLTVRQNLLLGIRSGAEKPKGEGWTIYSGYRSIANGHE